MKTQINDLRSGTKNQILNEKVDYSILPRATSHVGHAGSGRAEVEKIWNKVVAENPEYIDAIIKGLYIRLTANYSLSKKTVYYRVYINSEIASLFFNIIAAKDCKTSISISNANRIIIYNGKNDSLYICPSLVHIMP